MPRRGTTLEEKRSRRPSPVTHAEQREPIPAPTALSASISPITTAPRPSDPPHTNGELPRRDESSLPPLLFEIGWEVCSQLGGIYTVLKTKAVTMQRLWGDRYTLIGPYNPATAAMEFEELPPPQHIADALDILRKSGIVCHYGKWLINGRPPVVLLDYRSRYRHIDADKYLMWKDHGITLDSTDGEVNNVVAFGFAVADFFRALTSANLPTATNRPIIAHFHEWMGGVAVPRIAHERLPVRTVFTTHATLLGRYLAGDNPYFYDHLPYVNPEAEAQKYQIYPRYQIEKAAAHASTVFTTVSEVTAFEAEKLLGRTPDTILPNGINIQRFAALHEFQELHRQYKERIHEFVMGHFFPSYTFDLDNTLYFVISGRYEYKNKGMDMYLEALTRLNHRLKSTHDSPTVVAFIITRASYRNINVNALQTQTMFEELRNVCQGVTDHMGDRLFQAAATGRIPTLPELLADDHTVRLRRAMHAIRTHRQPGIVTHDLNDDGGDPVLRHLRHRNLLNAADDRVKVVFHADFVTATSPLIPLDYEQFVRGCHLGVFPSYYEPWGYTPMECCALGVPAVTTDLSGFGAYVRRHVPEAHSHGMSVLSRRGRSFEQCTEDLVEHMLQFCRMNRRQRIDLRNRTERLSELFDWNTLARHYIDAHELAMQRVPAAAEGKIDIKTV
jgi:glycogen(starch) synthase